ncbi:MAG: hypothetical protein AB7S59_19095, partial [Parvibaculaceae bacterium]
LPEATGPVFVPANGDAKTSQDGRSTRGQTGCSGMSSPIVRWRTETILPLRRFLLANQGNQEMRR